MDLAVSNLAVVDLFGIEVWITETMVNTWIVMAVLIILAIIGRIIMSRADLVPRGAQNAIEAVVEGFSNFVEGNVGPELGYVGPWFFAVAAFLVGSALISVLGFRAPTADWATAFALALCTFVIMVALGVRYRGLWGYLKTMMVPHWLFFPVNAIGELAKPVSLSFRLFGNMLSGTLIISLYNALTPTIASLGIPAILHLVFDVFFGVLQAYIFVIMSLSYIGGAVSD